uniref:Uncharacterized protein n=1 Tax=Mus musculus TaxID=10090 RepID=Q8BU01_MOUSE|nr:unnamed protein product [Mus musculus]
MKGDEVSITRREMLPSAPDEIKTPMTTIRFPKAKTLQILTLLISIGVVQTSPMPHEPHNLTWVITNTATGTVINSTSHLAPIGTWFPDLVFDLCALADGTWDPLGLVWGCQHPAQHSELRRTPFYVCPGEGRSPQQTATCGGPESYFCAYWGCESTGSISWTPPIKDDLIKVQRSPGSESQGWGYGLQPKLDANDLGGPCSSNCNPITVQFTPKGKESVGWEKGKTWGLRLYVSGYDYGVMFTIQLSARQGMPLGPNPALPPVGLTVTQSQITVPISQELRPRSGPWDLLKATYLVLNNSKPELTSKCWLCLDAQPPYYEGIAVPGNYTTSTDNKDCRWQYPGKGRLTLELIQGKGLCFGTIPHTHRHLCNSIQEAPDRDAYIIPPINTWWACTTGLTSCIHTQALNLTNGFCVLVQLAPRILRYSDEMGTRLSPFPAARAKRATVAEILGASAFDFQDENYKVLSSAIDADLMELGKSLSKSKTSLTSLREATLRNQREQDFQSLQQDGLCKPLEKRCCTFVDNLKHAKELLAKVRKRLEDRKREMEQGQPVWITVIATLSGFLGLVILIVICKLYVVNPLMDSSRTRSPPSDTY